MMKLGELETFVLKLIWEFGKGSVKDVYQRVKPKRAVTRNTVQSTLERLYRKGLLTRQKQAHAYIYDSRLTKEQLTAQLLGQLMSDFDSDPSMTIAAFVEQHDVVSDAKMQQLRQWLETIKKQESGNA
ncbi:BlaI/MecI/CopY family transcriptional regulator [Pseudidiomarina sp. E22-M8]|uniref:BlaI/MecI/CopY family transcriptional regulator n=1 Tax=Pseudidiomarina sp. E22-M8 TaxID=3424768 RepID=UPI00403C4AFB